MDSPFPNAADARDADALGTPGIGIVTPGAVARHGGVRRESALGWLVAGVGALAGAVVILALTLPHLGDAAPAAQGAPPSPSATPPASPVPPSPSVTPTPEVPTVSFTLVAAGDVLIHQPVTASATHGGVIDYAPLMAAVQPYIEGADLALCHMEVPVAPAGTAPSGYPMFGAPAEIVRDLALGGWDGCSTASNHSVDRKFAGITTTLDLFDSYGLGFAGTARTEQEAQHTQFYDVRTGDRVIRVANIAFTYGLNGLPVPAEAPWSVNLFNADAADATPIIAAAQAARDQGADVVVASVHCCVEYRTAPTDAQASIVSQIGASGLVDLYIGHHAHVPQPIELIPGGPSGTGMWAAYGLGNYLSNQDAACCVANTDSGVILTATIAVDPDDAVSVGVEWTPVTVDRRSHHTMHVLTDIPEGTATLSAGEVSTRLGRVTDAVGGAAPLRTTPATRLADEAYREARIP